MVFQVTIEEFCLHLYGFYRLASQTMSDPPKPVNAFRALVDICYRFAFLRQSGGNLVNPPASFQYILYGINTTKKLTFNKVAKCSSSYLSPFAITAQNNIVSSFHIIWWYKTTSFIQTVKNTQKNPLQFSNHESHHSQICTLNDIRGGISQQVAATCWLKQK